MNFYKCITATGEKNNINTHNVFFTWAESEDEAKAAYIKAFNYRKNKKGICISCISYVEAQRISQVVDELVTYKIDANNCEHKALTRVGRLCCSRCGEVAKNASYCQSCNAQFKPN